ncbi:hypothetical protein CQ056_01980 [Peribacillus simplex]|nr:hypothetical protein CQ056_01980 [Peribacillus simplex]
MIGTEGTRLLREKRGQGRPRRRTPRRLPGPPAESECLEWKSLHILPFGGVSASRCVAHFFIPIRFNII